MKPKAIIFDLDGTLCFSYPDRPEKYTWNEKSTGLFESVVSKLDKWTCIIILTGRKQKEYKEITEKWLEKQYYPYDKLIMNIHSCPEKNHIFKLCELYKLQQEYDIVMMYDDNPLVWDVCAKLWILLLQVHYPIQSSIDSYRKCV